MFRIGAGDFWTRPKNGFNFFPQKNLGEARRALYDKGGGRRGREGGINKKNGVSPNFFYGFLWIFVDFCVYVYVFTWRNGCARKAPEGPPVF
jgi:hypothetical protein